MEDQETRIKEELDVDDTNLAGELKRQAGKYFYWATLKSKMSSKARTLKTNLEAMKAQKSKKIRDDMAEIDPKVRVTERMLDDAIELDPDIQKIKDTLINAQYGEEILEAAVDAFRQRHYAIIELVRSKESERMIQNEYELMKKDFEERELRKRQGGK